MERWTKLMLIAAAIVPGVLVGNASAQLRTNGAMGPKDHPTYQELAENYSFDWRASEVYPCHCGNLCTQSRSLINVNRVLRWSQKNFLL
jgi:hypothetical protein